MSPTVLYAAALLLSAFLVFWVQLLLGRLLLPIYGGSPAVWTTCLLFFQAALLVGYGYAHGLRRLGAKAQIGVHAGVLALGAVGLPLALGSASPDGSPVASLLLTLSAVVGLPFVALSASAPLVQSWYSQLGRPDSHDPYSLYAASNFGSLLALVAYPFVLEPTFGIASQSTSWSVGYVLAALVLVVCGVMGLRVPESAVSEEASSKPLPEPQAVAPDWRQKLRWLIYAFVPAWLLYGVTSAVTTDLAAVPLLWAAPLALYLLSYVIAFRRGRRLLPRALSASLLAGVLLVLALTALVDLARFRPPWLWLLIHLLGVFAVSCFLHRDLADERPAAEHLTAFYLWLATGGVLAGVFCAALAPLLFDWPLEYPLGILAALLLLPKVLGRVGVSASRWPFRTLYFSLGILTVFLLAGFGARGFFDQLGGYALLLLPVAAAVALAFPWGKLRAVHLLGLGVLMGQCSLLGSAELVYRERSFFGVHRIVAQGGFLHYVSGSTVHGRQHLDPAKAREPLAYFARTAPLGQVFGGVAAVGSRARVGVLGLGVGCLAAYAQEGEHWRFFEIDPVVVRIAKDERFFSYLRDAAAPPEIVVGDGRLLLEDERDAGEPRYDVLALDAFSSDAVPVHLLTREALALYGDRLSPGGLLVANISNRFLNLEPLFARHLADGWEGVSLRKTGLTEIEKDDGESRSHVVVLAREASAFAFLEQAGWRRLQAAPGAPLWTDDHADLLGVVDFAGESR